MRQPAAAWTADFRNRIEKDPNDTLSSLRLGELLERKGASQEAARHYGRVAAIYTREGAPHKAIAVYQKMLELAVTPEGIHYRMGELYEKLGLPQKASVHYEGAARISERAGDPGTAAALRDRIGVLASHVSSGQRMPVLIGDVLACSFCMKQQRAVKKLIAGPTVYICNECVAVCADVVAKGT